MKTWSSDNPKAGLLKRKREAIFAAARQQFLANGYGGTSMEAVASDAGVSIMTLYRHAESKDDLFAAVIGIACHSDGEPEPDFSDMPLAEILEQTGVVFRAKLTSPETLSLLRAVIAEQGRFPELAAVAYDAAVGHLGAFLDGVLARSGETAALAPDRRRALAAAFIDDLFGADILRALLGLPGSSDMDTTARSREAAARAMQAFAAA